MYLLWFACSCASVVHHFDYLFSTWSVTELNDSYASIYRLKFVSSCDSVLGFSYISSYSVQICNLSILHYIHHSPLSYDTYLHITLLLCARLSVVSSSSLDIVPFFPLLFGIYPFFFQQPVSWLSYVTYNHPFLLFMLFICFLCEIFCHLQFFCHVQLSLQLCSVCFVTLSLFKLIQSS